MGAQRTPLRPTFSPARLGHVVYASFSGGQMETILAWDSTSHGGIMPEGYLHLTYEQRCQIYALLQSGDSQAYIACPQHAACPHCTNSFASGSNKEGMQNPRRPAGNGGRNDACGLSNT